MNLLFYKYKKCTQMLKRENFKMLIYKIQRCVSRSSTFLKSHMVHIVVLAIIIY